MHPSSPPGRKPRRHSCRTRRPFGYPRRLAGPGRKNSTASANPSPQPTRTVRAAALIPPADGLYLVRKLGRFDKHAPPLGRSPGSPHQPRAPRVVATGRHHPSTPQSCGGPTQRGSPTPGCQHHPERGRPATHRNTTFRRQSFGLSRTRVRTPKAPKQSGAHSRATLVRENPPARR